MSSMKGKPKEIPSIVATTPENRPKEQVPQPKEKYQIKAPAPKQVRIVEPKEELPFLDPAKHPTVRTEFAKKMDAAIEELCREGEVAPMFEKPGRAFMHEAPVEKGQSIEEMMRRIMDSPIEVSVAEFIGSSGPLREAVRKWMTKKRLPVEGSAKVMLSFSDLSEIREGVAVP